MSQASKRQPIPFGKYLLLDRVNIGGMAEVWRGKTFGAGGFERIVAIKRILPNIAEDEEFITMFIDEAKITVQLNHANVAQIYELSHVANSYFIAMEYISGKDMRAVFDRCRKKGEPAPIPLTCYCIARCAEGLDYAHRQKDRQGRDMNIVHRDVSPQNALISYEGEVKVIDFGIAKAAGKATKTQAGILKGKFGYMSPEQIRGLPLDRRSDVFAIGVCLYEMLTGERLFVGDSDFSVLEKVRKVEVLPPTTYNRRIPEALEKIVMKSLAKDVDERYQYASELADDLQRFLITNDSIFSRKDLAQYMKSTFAEEYEREKARMAEYVEIVAPEGMMLAAEAGFGAAPLPPPTTQAASPSAMTAIPTVAPSMANLQPVGGTRPGTRTQAAPPTLSPAPVQNMPPRMTPSIPRLTAVAPMLTNDKEENQATQMVASDGEGNVGASLFDDDGDGNAKTYARPQLAAIGSNGRGPITDPIAPSATPVRSLTMGSMPTDALGQDVGAVPDEMMDQGAIPTHAEGLNPNSFNSTLPGRHSDLSPLDATIPPQRRMSAARLRPVSEKRSKQEHIDISQTNPDRLFNTSPEDTSPELAPAAKAIMGIPRPVFFGLLGVLVLAIAGTIGVFAFGSKPTGLLLIEIPTEVQVPVEVNINGAAIPGDQGRPWTGGDAIARQVVAGPATVILKAKGYKLLVDDTITVKEGNMPTRMLSRLEKDKEAKPDPAPAP
ncbi:MAG: protein kinase [Myxococcaceae bacterium]